MKYPAVFAPDREVGGFVITFPDFAKGASQAESEEEAREMAEDLLVTLIGLWIKDQDALPKPGRLRGKNIRAIEVPPLVAAKAELYEAMRAQNIRKADLAKRLGIPRQEIERLLNVQHNTRFDRIQDALAAVGKRLVLTVEDAA